MVSVINVLAQSLVILVFVSVILSYVLDPYHPVRRGVDNLVQPMLDPIRRIVPPMGGLDFSPLVLILLIQFLARIIIVFLTR
jgi:YggT family protein